MINQNTEYITRRYKYTQTGCICLSVITHTHVTTLAIDMSISQFTISEKKGGAMNVVIITMLACVFVQVAERSGPVQGSVRFGEVGILTI